MQIVIKISEELYNDIQSRDWKNGELVFSEEWKAIHNGTPLPEGHGRMGDLDKLEKNMLNGIRAGNLEEGYENYENINTVDDCVDCVRYADTIIEADTPKRRKGTPLEENDSGYNCENWIP